MSDLIALGLAMVLAMIMSCAPKGGAGENPPGPDRVVRAEDLEGSPGPFPGAWSSHTCQVLMNAKILPCQMDASFAWVGQELSLHLLISPGGAKPYKIDYPFAVQGNDLILRGKKVGRLGGKALQVDIRPGKSSPLSFKFLNPNLLSFQWELHQTRDTNNAISLIGLLDRHP